MNKYNHQHPLKDLSKLKLYKGYCGEILGCKKENDVIINSSAFETNKHPLKENVLGKAVNTINCMYNGNL